MEVQQGWPEDLKLLQEEGDQLGECLGCQTRLGC